MQDKQALFEYAVIRVVPMVEREEFLNVGVILYCADQKFLGSLFLLDEERLLKFSGKLDMADLQCYLNAFQQISIGKSDSPVAKLPIPERFRWLTATRSTVVQTSKVHPGLCSDAGQKLRQLYEQLVLQ